MLRTRERERITTSNMARGGAGHRQWREGRAERQARSHFRSIFLPSFPYLAFSSPAPTAPSNFPRRRGGRRGVRRTRSTRLLFLPRGLARSDSGYRSSRRDSLFGAHLHRQSSECICRFLERQNERAPMDVAVARSRGVPGRLIRNLCTVGALISKRGCRASGFLDRS